MTLPRSVRRSTTRLSPSLFNATRSGRFAILLAACASLGWGCGGTEAGDAVGGGDGGGAIPDGSREAGSTDAKAYTGPCTISRVHLRAVVHRRHGLHDGHVDGLLLRELPLRWLGDQRRGPGAVQRRHGQDAAWFGSAGGRCMPVRSGAGPVLPGRHVLGDLLFSRRYAPRLRGRGRDVSPGHQLDMQQARAGRCMRVFRRGVLRELAPTSIRPRLTGSRVTAAHSVHAGPTLQQ